MRTFSDRCWKFCIFSRNSWTEQEVNHTAGVSLRLLQLRKHIIFYSFYLWQDSPSSCSEIKMLEYQTSGVFWFEDCGVVFHCCISYMIHITLTFSSWWHLSKNLFVSYCRSTEKEPPPYKTQVLSCSSSKTPLTWQSACRHHVSLCFHVLSV